MRRRKARPRPTLERSPPKVPRLATPPASSLSPPRRAFPTSRSASSTCLALEARRRRQADSRCGFPADTPPALWRLAGTPQTPPRCVRVRLRWPCSAARRRGSPIGSRGSKASREPYTGTLGASGPRSSVGSAMRHPWREPRPDATTERSSGFYRFHCQPKWKNPAAGLAKRRKHVNHAADTPIKPATVLRRSPHCRIAGSPHCDAQAASSSPPTVIKPASACAAWYATLEARPASSALLGRSVRRCARPPGVAAAITLIKPRLSVPFCFKPGVWGSGSSPPSIAFGSAWRCSIASTRPAASTFRLALHVYGWACLR